MLNANFARNYRADTTISSLVDGITNADDMRIRLAVNGIKARKLMNTGAVFSFLANQFVQKAGIPTICADIPFRVDRAGTGIIRQSATFAMLQVEATAPMTKAVDLGAGVLE